jgi:hypothetical protein
MGPRYVNPMKLGEILDASFRLYRERFSLLVIAQSPMAVFYVLMVLVGMYSMGNDITDYTNILPILIFLESLTGPYAGYTTPILFLVQMLLVCTCIGIIIVIFLWARWLLTIPVAVNEKCFRDQSYEQELEPGQKTHLQCIPGNDPGGPDFHPHGCVSCSSATISRNISCCTHGCVRCAFRRIHCSIDRYNAVGGLFRVEGQKRRV